MRLLETIKDVVSSDDGICSCYIINITVTFDARELFAAYIEQCKATCNIEKYACIFQFRFRVELFSFQEVVWKIYLKAKDAVLLDAHALLWKLHFPSPQPPPCYCHGSEMAC